MTNAVQDQSHNGLAPLDSQLSQREFQTLATLVLEFTGISVPDSKRTLLQSRLAKRLRALQISDFGDYCRFVQEDSEAARYERQELISAVTTNVTRFFREPHHFRDLKTRVLPALLRKAQQGDQVRIWSSACSSGEEPYSLAFTILDLLPDAHRLDIKILATDLDQEILRTAVVGKYPISVVEDIKANSTSDHVVIDTSSETNCVRIGEAARAMVSFKQLNLVSSWPFRGGFDVIMCRNVLIYFERNTDHHVFTQFSRYLKKGGYLYLGHSERLDTNQFPGFKNDGVTTYRRV